MRHLVDDGAFASLEREKDPHPILLALGSLLAELQHAGEQVGVIAGWAAFRVGSTDLGTFLSELLHAEPVVRDAALLAMSGLDKAIAWDTDPELMVDPAVEVDGAAWESYAAARCADVQGDDGQVLACVTLGHCFAAGLHSVRRADGTVEQVPFLVAPGDGVHLARRRLVVETRNEAEFFALTDSAFPGLIFAMEVTFRRFDGTFSGLKCAVVDHLVALNDHFSATYQAEAGNLGKVATRLGVAMSNEGNTRSSERLMRQRDVVVSDRTYRCEIHTKIEPHRNRIHFHPGDQHSGGKLVVGIFVSHLDT